MTPEVPRSRASSIEPAADLDLLAGLWQEAPFARLPSNAPPELEAFVQNIENPARVYAIHRASRRHDFQLLVERYIVQLRSGCGNFNCATSTCFTCRRRLAGKTPIRKYNATSARTLAIYLASQDNPENGICPFLRKSKEPVSAVGTLIFSTRPPSPSHPDSKRPGLRTSPGTRKDRPCVNQRTCSPSAQVVTPSSTSNPICRAPSDCKQSTKHSPSPTQRHPSPRLQVVQGPVSKDHRSFAANLFGTVTFKMLEWLTQRGVAAMSQQINDLEGPPPKNPPIDSNDPPTPSNRTNATPCIEGRDAPAPVESRSTSNSARDGYEQNAEIEFSDPSLSTRSSKSSHGSLPKSWNPASPKARKTSYEAVNAVGGKDDSKPAILSPRVNSFLHDKHTRSKTNITASARGIPEVPTKPAFFENVTKPSAQSLLITGSSSPSTSPDEACDEHIQEMVGASSCRPTHDSLVVQSQSQGEASQEVSSPWLNSTLPQALSRLDVDLVNFICDVYEEDGTSENRPGYTRKMITTHPGPVNAPRTLNRRSSTTELSKKQWKDFNEQTLFNVLMDPHAVVQSFTCDQKLYDSQTLWYCLHRMNRVAPSLVFHSLWMAAGRLFIPSQDLPRDHSHRVKGNKSQNSRSRLSTTDAGHLMSICLHALVAAAPVVPDSRTLYEMSRIRSNGLTLAGGSAVARQPPSRCLDYDDAFSNDLAIRLARRLFCAITARRCFADMARSMTSPCASDAEPDILQPLVDQLDFLSPGSASVLEFTQSERLLHETRVPTVLLDWARTILLNEWDGGSDFAMDGPFGGAMSFIETMHSNRNLLLLGDVQFRVDYLSDRLDSIEMPVDWLSFNSTRWRRHILDYPYIFSPETLVSFFRSINFARMSRMFEESSSLKTRMSAIVDPGSLITNPHHKMVLQDLLRTASSKYLILEISRENVARDAFDQLWRREERELLRPLKVHLGEDGGEEGFDSGGVQQEFFRLAIAECLNPEYGAFTVDERTRMAWFAPGSLTEDWKYELVGLLMSLALYNGLTLPITFPRALYRKLLGKPVEELHHIGDGWPDLASGLTTLLEWDEKDGLVEDVFARTYEFSVSALGTNVTREMGVDGTTIWPKAAAGLEDIAPPQTANPDDAPLVTNDNRDEYVVEYIRYLTDISVRPQFLAFERGFNACLDKKSLSLLNPSTLQSLVEGIQDIEISELKRYARYVGWDASHHTIKDFWSIVKRYDDRMKRRLLEFVTSSDRVPVGGMKNLQFVIQKNGEEGDGGHLPTAYTCYGTLLLPEYRDKDALKERLGMALENAQGFGFA
ncbi:ubiquitin- ligase [Fusarium albosuccineum]|uniref:HECT-type E3 ubiquitin transferase n=1 Tax=Fusarium albosuccineum TaxID=1237068 RepID=A0A8H4LAI0_9HYPO|nr:ubiquitin- ligase [Fusarium albosuccineum]